MSRTVELLTVFLSSPADVGKERAAIRSAAALANGTSSSQTKTYLEVVGQEDVPSNQAEDAQQVINQFMTGRYDVYIAVIGHGLGTPTPRARSGTLEEYELAKEARRLNPSLRIMVYLRRLSSRVTGGSRAELDELRQRLGDEGIFYGQYGSANELQTMATRDLAQVMQAWRLRAVEVSAHER